VVGRQILGGTADSARVDTAGRAATAAADRRGSHRGGSVGTTGPPLPLLRLGVLRAPSAGGLLAAALLDTQPDRTHGLASAAVVAVTCCTASACSQRSSWQVHDQPSDRDQRTSKILRSPRTLALITLSDTSQIRTRLSTSSCVAVSVIVLASTVMAVALDLESPHRSQGHAGCRHGARLAERMPVGDR